MKELKEFLDQLESAIKNRQKSTVRSLIEKGESLDLGDEPIPLDLQKRAERLSEKANDLLSN